MTNERRDADLDAKRNAAFYRGRWAERRHQERREENRFDDLVERVRHWRERARSAEGHLYAYRNEAAKYGFPATDDGVLAAIAAGARAATPPKADLDCRCDHWSDGLDHRACDEGCPDPEDHYRALWLDAEERLRGLIAREGRE